MQNLLNVKIITNEKGKSEDWGSRVVVVLGTASVLGVEKVGRSAFVENVECGDRVSADEGNSSP